MGCVGVKAPFRSKNKGARNSPLSTHNIYSAFSVAKSQSTSEYEMGQIRQIHSGVAPRCLL
jgi:hypothetical protein